jgi:hypothetical protein
MRDVLSYGLAEIQWVIFSAYITVLLIESLSNHVLLVNGCWLDILYIRMSGKVIWDHLNSYCIQLLWTISDVILSGIDCHQVLTPGLRTYSDPRITTSLLHIGELTSAAIFSQWVVWCNGHWRQDFQLHKVPIESRLATPQTRLSSSFGNHLWKSLGHNSITWLGNQKGKSMFTTYGRLGKMTCASKKFCSVCIKTVGKINSGYWMVVGQRLSFT